MNIEKANASRKDPERIAARLERARKNREMKQRKFLEVFARRAIKTPAYKAAQINSRMLRRWLDTDPAFARDYERAFEEAADGTEQKIASVAFKGVPKTIFNPKTGEKHTDYIADTKVLMRIAAKQRPNEWGVQAQQPTLPAGDGVVTMVWGWAQMALPQAKPDLGKQNQLEEPTINAEIIKTEE